MVLFIFLCLTYTDAHIGKAQIVLSDSEVEIVEPPSAPSPRRLRRKPVDDAPYQESEEDEPPAPPSPPSQRKRMLRKRGDDAPYQQSEADEPPAPPSPPSQRKRAHRKKADKNQESEEDEPQQKRKRLAPAEPLSPSSFMNTLRELQDKKMAALERKEQANAKELELVKEKKNLVEAQIKLRESQRADNEAAEAKGEFSVLLLVLRLPWDSSRP